jgi:CheY-like chemotaxis protein
VQVLLCEDDAATRLVTSRVLKTHLGCTVMECKDGAEALERLESERFDLLVLDLEMPVLGGEEVLEVIRASKHLNDLPVLVVSSERRSEVIARLVRLGVTDYLLKPLHVGRALERLAALKRTLPVRPDGTDSPGTDSAIRSDSPVMIVDGNLDYRHFFASQVGQHGAVIEADSGIAAVTRFQSTSPTLIFVGSNLGAYGAGRLLPKLRAMSPRPLLIVGIVDDPEGSALADGDFDAVIARTLDPETFQEHIRQFIRPSGPLSRLGKRVPGLLEAATGAVSQVFGMMIDAVVGPADTPPANQAFAVARVPILIEDRFRASVGVHLTRDLAAALAARTLSCDVAQLSEEQFLPSAAELSALIAERINAQLVDASLTTSVGAPEAEVAPSFVLPPEDQGFALWFSATGAPGSIGVSIHVSDA